ncbi:Methylase of chemotaxis methyl-accepting protein [gamma proteobacterium HdN1]|nr:Methylase of chemotaxis methyl-accepting protein [gamma proteobacterium HdN1]
MSFEASSRSRFNDADYAIFRQFLEKSCGILLGENKNYLIDSRLRKILSDQKISSLADLVRLVERRGNELLRQTVIDAMTTNETLWFRDRHPFEYFSSTLLPELMQSSDVVGRIWCAASSTGQEPYTISMCIDEYRKKNPLVRRDVSILATDISAGVLEQARSGVYDSLAINRGLSQDRLSRYFKALPNNQWEVKPEIRQRVEYRQLNLKDSLASLGRFDVVFCRNVLIYFSTDLQAEILRKIHGVLKPNGHLFLGGSETPKGLSQYFSMRYYTPGVIYQKK